MRAEKIREIEELTIAERAESLPILEVICDKCSITVPQLFASTKFAQEVTGRIVTVRIFQKQGFGPVKIGRIINRDHTTVMHHQDVFQRLWSAYDQEEPEDEASQAHKIYLRSLQIIPVYLVTRKELIIQNLIAPPRGKQRLETISPLA